MSCSWRFKCALNASTACGVRRMDRRLFLVLLAKHYFPTAPGQRTPHARHSVLQVHVLPPERQQLSLPHASMNGEDVQRFETVFTG